MHLQRVVLQAPAKINLFLDITGRLENGYHTLDTVMQTVALQDILIVGRRTEPGIRVTCSRPGIPEDSRNLVHRAAAAFADATGAQLTGVHIHIDKSVPPQAGLGGGSADAAAALVGLDTLAGTALGAQRLRELGLILGADIPFLIEGGCARARGIGEQLESLVPGLAPCHLLIAKPAAGVSTQAAYKAYDQSPDFPHSGIDSILRALRVGDIAATAGQLFNVFELACPDARTARIKAAMCAYGASGAVLSGSGSAVVGIFADEANAPNCAKALATLTEEVFLTRPMAHGVQVLHKS